MIKFKAEPVEQKYLQQYKQEAKKMLDAEEFY